LSLRDVCVIPSEQNCCIFVWDESDTERPGSVVPPELSLRAVSENPRKVDPDRAMVIS